MNTVNDYQISPTYVIDSIVEQLERQEVIDRYPKDCRICGSHKTVQLVRLFTNDYGLRGQEKCYRCIYDCTQMMAVTPEQETKK